MKKLISILMVAMVVAAAVGCCPCRKGKNSKPLVGTEWHVMTMMGQSVDVADDEFVFQFGKDGRFSGVGACNRMMGDYTVTDKGAIKFGALAGTRMMCPKVSLEADFTRIIHQATHYEIDGDMLIILSTGEAQMVLKAK